MLIKLTNDEFEMVKNEMRRKPGDNPEVDENDLCIHTDMKCEEKKDGCRTCVDDFFASRIIE